MRRASRGRAHRWRGPLLWLAGVRIVLGIIAIPLAPVLYKKHFLLLVLMRPTKEVLLAAGFLARQNKVDLTEILIAAVPLAIIGVWHSFALGRGYATEIRNGDLPGIGNRILPVGKIRTMQKLLRKKGTKLVFVGRLAAFPSAVVGAAAGSSGMSPKSFLPADGIGGLLSIAEAIGAGYLLGSAYQDGKKWLTLVGVLALAALAVVVGRYLRKDS
jgi:membrane protein DedA with SNARE-associated domain